MSDETNEAQQNAAVTSAAQKAAEAAAPHVSTTVDIPSGGAATTGSASLLASESVERRARYYSSVGSDAPHAYDPVSPFRLSFTFTSDGTQYQTATLHDPVFIWQYMADGKYQIQEVEAEVVGTLPVTGTIYLNITLETEGDDAGKVRTATVSGQVDESADASMRLYELDANDGVVLDLRHALLALGGGGGGGGGGGSLKPFTLRWHPTSSENPNVGEWQVYIPFAAATIKSYFGMGSNSEPLSYVPTNDDGTAGPGDVSTYGWYKITPRDADKTVSTDHGVTTTYWTVYAHFMPWPTMEVTTNPAGSSAHSHWWNRVSIGALYIEESIDEETGEPVVVRSTQSWQSSPIAYTRDDHSTLSITYKTNGDPTSKNAVWSPYLTSIEMTFGRESVSRSGGDVSIQNMQQVVLWVKHPDQNIELDVVAGNGLGNNDDDNTYIVIYDVDNEGVVVHDYRSRVTAVPWYNN